MPTNLIEFIDPIIETAFTLAKADVFAPLAGFIGSAVAKHLTERFDSARIILRSECERVASETNDFRDAEQFAVAALRYVRAARDQSADTNLRLLAQCMIGLARREALWSSKFLEYAEILAPLSRDEIAFIGALAKIERWWLTQPSRAEQGFWISFADGINKLTGFAGPDLQSIGLRAARSGMLTAHSLIGGELGFRMSPLGWRICEFAAIEAYANPKVP